MLLIILVVLILLFFVGGAGWSDYRGPGWGLAGLLVVILLVLYLTGNLK